VAILCYQRLLLDTLNNSSGPINGLYLTNFDALLKWKSLRNKQAVSKRIVLLFLQILETDTFINKSLEICQFVTTVFDRRALLVLNALNRFLD
jgi:hypothetical protein